MSSCEKLKRKYRCPTMMVNGKQVLVSRHTMEKKLGRKLLSSEIVHHKNEDPFDNKEDNLQVVTRSQHKKIHFKIGQSTRLVKLHHFDVQELVALYEKPMSFVAIASLKGCSEKTIRRTLKPILGGPADLRSTRARYSETK